MGLVIDTNILINAENGLFDLSSLEEFECYGEGFIAAVTVSELLTGVHLAKNTDLKIKRSAFVEGIISKIPILEFNEEAARVYSEIYSHFITLGNKKNGNVHDLQIAATAISRGHAVLTNNTADFMKIPGLKVESPLN